MRRIIAAAITAAALLGAGAAITAAALLGAGAATASADSASPPTTVYYHG